MVVLNGATLRGILWLPDGSVVSRGGPSRMKSIRAELWSPRTAASRACNREFDRFGPDAALGGLDLGMGPIGACIVRGAESTFACIDLGCWCGPSGPVDLAKSARSRIELTVSTFASRGSPCEGDLEWCALCTVAGRATAFMSIDFVLRPP